MLLVASGMFAMFFFNTLYIQQVLGYGPLKAGLAFLPFTAGIMVSAGLASRFAPTVGVRPVAIVGMVVTIAGMLLLTRIAADGTYAVDVLPALVLTSLGHRRGLRAADADRHDGPRTTTTRASPPGLFNTSQQIGGALGLAILSSLAASATANATGVSDEEALVKGFHVAFAGGAVFMVVALGVFLAMLRAQGRRADRGRGGRDRTCRVTGTGRW